ncbi:MAG: hypothetical protein ACI959_002206 [Limisphaerales bacterium]|jgi:hypothetical protein
MNLDQLKIEYLKARTQFVLFNYHGEVLDSCDTLFKLKSKDFTVFDFFPLFDSIKDEIKSLSLSAGYVTYPMVEFLHADKGYILDLQLKRIEEHDVSGFIWIINDNTKVYQPILNLKKAVNSTLLKNDPTSLS